MQKQKQTATVFLAFAVCASLIITAYARTTPCFSWYTVPKNDGSRPDSFEAKDIIEKYNTIFLGKADEKKIYLTFDAGYENGNVEKTLDALKKHNVKGAFFVLPHFIKANPELIDRMISEGHLICNHSTSHRDMSSVSDPKSFKAELEGIEKVYKEQTGKEMAKYYRPPEGRFSELNLKHATELGYKTVFWSLAYADWDNNNQMAPERAKKLILSRMHNGCVLLLHPTSETNAVMLDGLISDLKNAGYSFGTLDEFE